jgi:branched-chain amino acid transport system substrate-binding protein
MSSERWRWIVALALLAGVVFTCGGCSCSICPWTERPPAVDLILERSEVWQQPQGQTEREVTSNTQAGKGDQVWTKQSGEALLKWPDLWVRLYDDTDLVMEEVTPSAVRLNQNAGTTLNGGVSKLDEYVLNTGDHAEIRFVGTTFQVTYDPPTASTVVRVFGGQARVRNLEGVVRTETVGRGQLALVEPGEPPQVYDDPDEWRSLVRGLGLWDVFQRVELDVQAGFGPLVSQVAPENVAIVFPAVSSEPIRIAILAMLTGELAELGAPSRDGAIMAFEEWNAKGGVLGRQIEAVAKDTQPTLFEPRAAAEVARKLIDEAAVQYILGGLSSAASISVSEYANEKGVLQISSLSTRPQVTVDANGDVKPYTFRACFIDPFDGRVMARFALENLGAQTAAVVLIAGNDYSQGLAEYFGADFGAGGGDVVVWESFGWGDTDFSAILAKVKEASPDVLFLPTTSEHVGLFAAQAKEMDIAAVLLGGGGWASQALDLDAADGAYYSSHYSPDDPRPIVQDFVKRYGAKYGSVPDEAAVLAYDAASMLLQAIANAGVDDPAVVKDAMEELEFEAVSGKITFDEYHNPVKDAVILHIKDGQVVFEMSISP